MLGRGKSLEIIQQPWPKCRNVLDNMQECARPHMLDRQAPSHTSKSWCAGTDRHAPYLRDTLDSKVLQASLTYTHTHTCWHTSLETEKEVRQAAEIELSELQTQYSKALEALQQLENTEEDGRARIVGLLMKLEVSVHAAHEA
jgi:hypothetical protein